MWFMCRKQKRGDRCVDEQAGLAVASGRGVTTADITVVQQLGCGDSTV